MAISVGTRAQLRNIYNKQLEKKTKAKTRSVVRADRIESLSLKSLTVKVSHSDKLRTPFQTLSMAYPTSCRLQSISARPIANSHPSRDARIS